MTKLLALTLSCLFTVAAGCGTSDSGSTTIDAGTLAGMVYGQPWTFQAGGTDAFLSANDDNFFATFYQGAFTCGSEPSGPSLIVAVPKVPGDYPMSLMRNMTFVMGSDNKVAIDGRVVVDSVTATTVTGGLVGTFDDQNTVSGHFTLTVCPATN
ncbi:MAG: hypothetical protein ABJE66_13330 [Deltaproteobacteria bacterium]